jgi:hypothetical protein
MVTRTWKGHGSVTWKYDMYDLVQYKGKEFTVVSHRGEPGYVPMYNIRNDDEMKKYVAESELNLIPDGAIYEKNNSFTHLYIFQDFVI